MADNYNRLLTFTRQINPRRLNDELIAIPGASKTIPHPVDPGKTVQQLLAIHEHNSTADTLKIWPDDTLPQSVLDQITNVINNHDGTPDPVPDPPNLGADVPDDFLFQINQQISIMRNYLTLTATQAAAATAFVPAIRATIRVVLFLVKRALT